MSSFRSRAAAAVVGSIALSVLASACGTSSTNQGVSANKADLVLGMEADIPSWDPAKLLPGSVAWASQAVYDTIFSCDAQGNVRPDIAQSYAFTNNNTKLTLHIRPGMKFSDGAPVDAQAVAANLEHAAKSPGGATFLPGAKATATDTSTVVVTVPQPTPYLVTNLCGGGSSVADPKVLASGQLNTTPMGSGPYVYDKADSIPGSTYVFTKNSANWNANQYPYQRITLKVLADRTARLNALITGQIAGAVTDASTFTQLKPAGLQTVTQQGEWAGLLIEDRQGKIIPALGNLNVRRAINMVFDKAQIAQKLYQGHAEQTDQIFRKGSPAYIPGLKDPYPFDLTQAKKLMAAAGYANGFSVQIPFLPGFGLDPAMPIVLQGLKALNINATESTLSGTNALLDLLSGKYPIIFWPLGNHGDSRLDIASDIVSSGIWNTAKVSDPKIDQLWQTILTSQGQPSVQAQQQLNQYVIDQAWFAPWVYVDSFFAYNPKQLSITTDSDINQLAPNLSDFQ